MEKKKPNSTHTTLELDIISCDNLKAFNFFRKLNTYVTVSIIQDDNKNPKHLHNLIPSQRTPIDRTGHRNPEWKHVIILQAISDEKVSLKFEVMCEDSVLGDWKIGDVSESFQFDKNKRFSKFSLKDSDGKGRGDLNMSYKFSKETDKIEEEDKIVQMKSYSSMKFNSNTVFCLMKPMEWPILPSNLVSDMEERKQKISSHDGSCNEKVLCPLEMKSLSFNTGNDKLGKNCIKYSIRGSAKWDIELHPRAGRFPGLLARNRSQSPY